MNPKKVKIVERKLGRERADGQANIIERTIEIDPTVSEERRVVVMVHEALHLADWDLPEDKVTQLAEFVGPILWKHGYRRTIQ
jgi:hypothetical protein